MGVSFAGVAIPPAATAAVQAWGWRGAWVAMAFAAALLLYPAAMVQRGSPEDHGLFPDGKTPEQIAAGGGRAAALDFATSMTRRAAIRTVTFYLIVIAFGFGGLSISVMLLQTIPFMTDAGYSRGVASLMIVLISTPSLLSKPAWGYLLDRASPRSMAAFGFLVNAIALVLIVVMVRLQVDVAVYASFILLGFGWGGFIPLQEVIWATYFGRRYLGAVRSAGLPVALILQAGGPLAASVYFDRVGDYNGAFLGVAFLSAVAVVLVQFLRRPSRPQSAGVVA
jgi:sugar phosphate permease